MMNEDLRMRLSHTPTPEEERFFDALCIDLVDQMLQSNIYIFYNKVIENGEDDTAYVEYREDLDWFAVHIDSRLDFGSRCDYLIHELAHVMSWRQRGDDHGEFWGHCYAVLYRQYLKTYKTFWK